MKKYIIMFIILLLPLNIYAATGSIKASSSSSNVTINNTFTVTVKVSSSGKLGSWQFGVSYDKSKLSLISGEPSVVQYGDGVISSKTYTYKFKAIAVGTATFNVENTKLVDWDSESVVATSGSTIKINIKKPVIINYSSDNNLKSLSIDGFEISPKFDQKSLEYTSLVTADTTKIKINGEVNDKKAKVSGLGEFDVKEGLNEFNVVVTAENGTSKTYVVKVTVPEKDPIVNKFKNGEFNILRKLPENLPTNFVASTIKFNEEEVACLKNDTLNLTLLYLRDSNNKEGFYIYDEVNNEVSFYNEVGSNDFKIYLTNKEINIKNLIKEEITINDEKVFGYRLTKDSNNYVISGTNISTGKNELYLYDSVNKIISLFSQKDFENLNNSNKLYMYVSIGLGICVVILLLALILINNSKNKLTKVFMQKQEEMVNQINKEKENNANKKNKRRKSKEDKDLDNDESNELIFYGGNETMSIHSETQVVDFRGELPEKKENASVFSESFPYISKLGSSLGNLRYFDRSDNTIDYRIFVEGFPVFGTDSRGQIGVEVGGETNGSVQVNIQTSLNTIQVPIPSDEEVELASTNEIIQQLEAKGADSNKIGSVIVGYTWQNVKETNRVVDLLPEWYVKYEDNWYSANDLLEKLPGLEAN